MKQVIAVLAAVFLLTGCATTKEQKAPKPPLKLGGEITLGREAPDGEDAAPPGPFVASSYRVVVEWRVEGKKPSKVSCATIAAIHPSTRWEVQGMAASDGSKVFSSRVPLELWCSTDEENWEQVDWAPTPDDIIANKFTIVHTITGPEDPCR